MHWGAIAWQAGLRGGFVFRTRVGVATRGRGHPLLRIANVIGAAYREIPGVPMPGRTMTGGVESIMQHEVYVYWGTDRYAGKAYDMQEALDIALSWLNRGR
jgi:hypothetical protein